MEFIETCEASQIRIENLKTVGDVIDLIEEMATCDDEELAQHALTLRGPRTRGSTTEHGLDIIPPATPLSRVQMDAVNRGCVAYSFNAPALRGRLGVLPLTMALDFSKERGIPILLRDGVHGPELYMDFPGPNGPETDLVCIICGLHGKRPAVFTWHPGLPLNTLSDGLGANTAVKTHSGL